MNWVGKTTTLVGADVAAPVASVVQALPSFDIATLYPLGKPWSALPASERGDKSTSLKAVAVPKSSWK